MLREKMIQVTKDFGVLDTTEEAENLADEYIRQGDIPRKV
jgi:hypothetical protein